MTTLMQGTFGGQVRQTGPRRIEADDPHLPITILMAFPVLCRDVVRVLALWDPLHRSFEKNDWLIVDTRDGRQYRVGKAPREEVDYTLGLLRSWGLPA